MSFVANPFVIVLDANVLFPFRVRDVLLTFAQEGLFRARFTDEILDEWARNLIRLKPHLEAHGGEHRLTKPNHLWTNGQVERMNHSPDEVTDKRLQCESQVELCAHLLILSQPTAPPGGSRP
jgi:hypothetical protein